jgi:NAD(P)-dependent dehydrogenase (short-subunit alcohol dehydrogenase family)
MDPRPVVLVTGAARRIGRVIAMDLAAHGYDIAVHFRSSRADALATVAQVAAQGARAQAFQADLSDEEACRGLIGSVVTQLGRVDAVVNNASTFEPDAAATFGHKAMEIHWRANTAPAVLLAQALHGHLMGRGATGCVVNLLDQKLWNLNPDYFSYTMSKAALQAATVMLAQAYAPVLRVCGVAPGVTLASDAMTPEQFSAAHRLTPLRRSSTPQDVAHAVRFLLESPAVTGTNLLVDGGQHLCAQPRDVLYLAESVARE